MIPEILQYEFMVRAFLVGVFMAVGCATLGNFVVSARQAVISDMLAHTALVGVGLGMVWQISPTMLALPTTVCAALLLWWLGRRQNQAPEALSMLLLTGGLATAILLAHLDRDNPIGLETYLFGSILTITELEMKLFIFLNLLIILSLLIFWRPFLALVFDRDFAQTQKFGVIYEIIFMILIALTVAIGLKVIGGLLIGALLVIPVLAAQNFAPSFRANVLASVGINVLAVLIGISASFYLDIPSSSAIVLALILFFLFAKMGGFWWGKSR